MFLCVTNIRAKLSLNLGMTIPLIGLAIISLALTTSAQASESHQSSLIISYRATPAGRPKLLNALRSQLIPRLQNLYVKEGIAHYRVLFSRLIDANTWDALVILEFHNKAQIVSWQAIDTLTPAGLDSKILTNVSTVESTVADCIGSAGPLAGGPEPVYMAIPYDYFVPATDYVNYVRSYVEPQTDGWIRAGALNAYQVYTARYAAGRNWMSLLLLAYHGENGLDLRNTVVAATRKTLATNAEWSAHAQGKEHIRTEKAAMIADMIAGE